MPAGTTHYLFSKDILEDAIINIKPEIKNYSMYYLGSTGPDIFFYNEPLKPRDRINRFGNLIHREKVMETLDFMYDYSENDEDLRSYYYGFLTHYCLDSKVHPLVNYASNEILSQKETVSVNHYRIESFFDTLMLERHGFGKKRNPYPKDIRISGGCVTKLADMYIALNEKLFKYQISRDEFLKLFKGIYTFIDIAYRPSRITYAIACLIEKVLGRGHFVTSIMLFNERLPKQEEVLNLNHQQYYNPSDPRLTFNGSLDDLFREAKEKYLKIVQDRNNKDLYNINYNGEYHE